MTPSRPSRTEQTFDMETEPLTVTDDRRQDREAREAIERTRTHKLVVVQVEDLDRVPITWKGNGTIYSREDERPAILDARDMLNDGRDAA